MKKIENFEGFLNEGFTNIHDTAPAPKLLKSLAELEKGFENEEEIIKAITALGFERKKSGLEITADYVFQDPNGDEKKYISYTTGYVRYNEKYTGWRGEENITRTPISRSLLPDVKDRLLLILRIALKSLNLYNDFKKSHKTTKEFIESKRVMLSGRKFGL
jgi:hypothetical protein